MLRAGRFLALWLALALPGLPFAHALGHVHEEHGHAEGCDPALLQAAEHWHDAASEEAHPCEACRSAARERAVLPLAEAGLHQPVPQAALDGDSFTQLRQQFFSYFEQRGPPLFSV